MKIKAFLYKKKHGSIFLMRAWDHESLESIDEDLSNVGDTRISEIVEIDFPELPQDTIINNQVAAIDKIITKKEGEHHAEMECLKQKRQELLAITYQDE